MQPLVATLYALYADAPDGPRPDHAPPVPEDPPDTLFSGSGPDEDLSR